MHARGGVFASPSRTFFTLATLGILALVGYVLVFGIDYRQDLGSERDLDALREMFMPPPGGSILTDGDSAGEGSGEEGSDADPARPRWLEFRGRRLTTPDILAPGGAHAPILQWPWSGGEPEAAYLYSTFGKLAAEGVGGLEIRPVAEDDSGAACAWSEVFYSETHYYRLALLLSALQSRNLFAELSPLPGRLLGDPLVTPDESLQALNWTGDRPSPEAFPREVQTGITSPRIHNPILAVKLITGLERQQFYPEEPRLLSLLAVRENLQTSSLKSRRSDDPMWLDFASARLIDPRSDEKWQERDAGWTLISSWIADSGERLGSGAGSNEMRVVDYFRPEAVEGVYSRLFGTRSLLPTFFGDSGRVRAFVGGGFDFRVARPVSHDLLEQFEARRGYSLEPWLPILMPTSSRRQEAGLPFNKEVDLYAYGEYDDRVLYDYQLTMSELFAERFLAFSARWAHSNQIGHRTLLQGKNLNLIKAAGSVSLPQIGFYPPQEAAARARRLVPSGAFLHDRPLVSAAIGTGPSGFGSPAEIKRALDAAFAAGANHIVYQRAAPSNFCQREQSEDASSAGEAEVGRTGTKASGEHPLEDIYPIEGALPAHRQELNQYVSRLSLLMRSGKEQVDVLIYYPFIGDGQGDSLKSDAAGAFPSPVETWFGRMDAAIQILEDNGLNWAWADDEALQKLQFTGGVLKTGEDPILAVIVGISPHIQPETASRLATLDNEGARIEVFGTAPARQPGRNQFELHDPAIARDFHRMLTNQASLGEGNLTVWARERAAEQQVAYTVITPGVRRVSRRGVRGVVHFFVNTRQDPATLQLQSRTSISRFLWFDPVRGSFMSPGEALTFELGAYESIVLLERVGPLYEVRTDPLLSWSRDFPDLSPQGVGANAWEFDSPEMAADERLFVELSDPGSAGYLQINDKVCTGVAFWPFRYDITDCVGPKRNRLELKLVLGQKSSTPPPKFMAYVPESE